MIPILVDDIDNNNNNNDNNDEDGDVKFEILIKKSIYNKKRWSYNIENILSPSDNHLKNDEVMRYLIKNLASKLDWTNRYDDDYALSISNLIYGSSL